MPTQSWNALPDSVALLDDAGRIVACSRAWRELVLRNGLLDPDACLKSNCLEICDKVQGPDSALTQSVAAGIRRVLADDAPAFELEYPCPSPDQERWFLLRATRLVENGRSYVVLLHEDITKRRQAEWELYNSRTLLKAIIEGTSDSVYAKDLKGRIILFNSAAEQIWSKTRAEVMGKEAPYLLDPGELSRIRQIDRDVIAAGIPVTTEEILTTPSGIRTFLNTRGPLRGADGEPIGLFGISRDITERKAAEEALRRSEERFRRYFQLGLVGLAITSPAKGWLDANDEICRILGYSHDELTKKSWDELTHPDDLAADVASFNQLMTGKIDRYSLDKRFIRKDGRVIDAAISVACVRKEDGTVDYVIGMLQDITQRKRDQEALRQSEEKYRVLTESNRDVVWTLDVETLRYLYVSPSVLQLRGFTSEEVMASPLAATFTPTAAGHLLELLHQRVADYRLGRAPPDKTYSLEIEQPCKDGSTVWTEVLANAFLNQKTGRLEIHGVTRDVSERKRAREALRRSEERYRRYFELGLIGMAITSPSKGWLEVNDEMCRILGYSREALLETTWDEITHPDDLPASAANFQRVLAGEIDGYSLEKRWIQMDGRIVETAVSVKCLRKPDGSVDHFVVLVQDVTAARLAEKALRASEEEFRSLAEAMPQIVWVTTPDGSNMYSNKQWVDYTGMTAAESQGDGWAMAFHPEDRQRAHDAWQHATQKGDPYVFECRLRRSDGVYRWWLTRGVPLRDAGGKILKWFGTCTDIDDIKHAQEALRASEEQHRTIIQTAMDGFFLVDEQGRLLEVNEAYCRMSGYSAQELLTLRNEDLEAAETPEQIASRRQKIRALGEDRFETRHRRKDGSIYDIEVSLQYRAAQGGRTTCFIRDISERKRAQEEAARHQAEVAHLARLNTMGQMVTGLAHELNQPLTAVRNYAHYCKSLLQTGRELGVKLPEALDKVDEAAARAAQIVQRLREFVRKQPPTRTATNIHVLLRKSLGLLAPILQRRQIRVELRAPENLPSLKIDPVQIEQVLVNLIQNAIDSMADVSPERRILALAIHAGRDDDSVHVQVADRGCGIPPENHAKIFEEFFTTKPQGSGLGLAISKSIVDTHGGRLDARCNPDGGMTFELVLPARKGT